MPTLENSARDNLSSDDKQEIEQRIKDKTEQYEDTAARNV